MACGRITFLLSLNAVIGEAVQPSKARSAPTSLHRFSPYEAEVLWLPYGAPSHQSLLQTDSSESSLLESAVLAEEQPLRILHITDNHISLDDVDPPRTTRMYNAFAHTSDHFSKRSSSPKAEFTSLLQRAKKQKVDLIALGGDLINYPSPKTVSWVKKQLASEAPGIPYIYTAGNHDWHEEGITIDKRYDSQRLLQLGRTLQPLFDGSAARADASAGPGAGHLYGHATVRGVDVFFVDNSNHQVNEEQLRYATSLLQQNSSSPAVLLMHMPLKLEATPTLEPKYLCGHPEWGAATDELYNVELRPRWPKEGNSPSTQAFIELIQKHSAPEGRLAALLTGHVHKDFSSMLEDKKLPSAANLTALSCTKDSPGCKMHASSLMEGSSQATGALQYATLDAAEGGYRLLTVRTARPHI